MEREIYFEENGVITLKEGVVIYVEKDKFKVISSDRKEVVHFDEKGKILDKRTMEVSNNIYTDFGCLKYFEKMGKKERKTVKHWIKNQKPKNSQEEAFFDLVKTIINEVQYSYYIATKEASFDGKKLCFKEKNDPCRDLTKKEWEAKAEAFAPQYKSRLASLYERYYWYTYKIAIGEWQMDDIIKANKNNIIVLRGL